MAKRYYWLKLKDDFFTNKRIKKLRSIAGGDTYTIIYLKMQLLSLKNEGKLYFDGVDESFADELSLELDEDVENVKITIQFLLKNGLLIEETRDEYVLPETKECVGYESDSKKRVAEHRQRKALREKIKLQYIQILSQEMIRTLTDNKVHYIDNKRYGGNAEYVYDLAMCKCENCGETNTNKFVIHHNNGYSNDLEDLYLLCPKCHRNVEAGNIKELKHNRRNYEQDLVVYEDNSVTCNTLVTKCNIEKEKEKEKEIDIEIEKDIKKNNKKKNEIYFENEEVNNLFVEFLNIRKKVKAVNSDLAIKKLINKLNKYGDDIKIKMLENSIVNSWKDVYELKEKKETALEKLQREIREAEEEERKQ